MTARRRRISILLLGLLDDILPRLHDFIDFIFLPRRNAFQRKSVKKREAGFAHGHHRLFHDIKPARNYLALFAGLRITTYDDG